MLSIISAKNKILDGRYLFFQNTLLDYSVNKSVRSIKKKVIMVEFCTKMYNKYLTYLLNDIVILILFLKDVLKYSVIAS